MCLEIYENDTKRVAKLPTPHTNIHTHETTVARSARKLSTSPSGLALHVPS